LNINKLKICIKYTNRKKKYLLKLQNSILRIPKIVNLLLLLK